jgi:hypothetical protein
MLPVDNRESTSPACLATPAIGCTPGDWYSNIRFRANNLI